MRIAEGRPAGNLTHGGLALIPMTPDQALAFTILAAVVVLLVWDRIRYDIVALGALLAAVAVGIVPAEDAFRGFSDDIVVIVASALVVSAGIARSGLIERLMRPLTPHMRRTEVQVAVLASVVAVLSAFMKNIGALAMFMPIAFQLARRTGVPASHLLMPLSFASLLGGLITLIGTSPNVIVGRLREELFGEPFRMFDFAPVGLGLTFAGVAFLTIGWRLLPQTRRSGSGEGPFSIEDYQTEVRVPEGSPFVGRTVAELEKLGEGDVSVLAIIREQFRRYVPTGDWLIDAGDILVLQCDAQALQRMVNEGKLELVHDKELPQDDERRTELAVVEAVVTPGSRMIGLTVEDLRLRERFGVNLLALSRSGRYVGQRLRRVRFQAGDLLVLRAPASDVGERLASLGCLPLAERNLRLGARPRMWLPALILAAAMMLVVTGTVSIAVAFFGAAVAMLLARVLSPTEAYEALDVPVLVLLASLIPVSEALRTTGGTDLIAQWMSIVAAEIPASANIALLLVTAMAVTPFLNNAATVLVLAPIAGSLAQRLAVDPDPFLMAVAVGAACDFLTPIGHQCNTLVMGPGGYRFGDYWRLGLPLSLLVVLLGTALIWYFWA
ncbi:MAG: SLC13 family permease [Pseudomonadota bacterium]